jgi:glutamate-5-semialdehyde dehydrogenase
MLDEARIEDMAKGVKAIATQDEVVGEFYKEFTNDEGLRIKRQRVPLGVILMIFESRPNVVIDCAALALKSSNAIILKGGKEAKHSNEILGKIIQDTLEGRLPIESVQVLASDSREEVNELLQLDEYIDVVIPRGGEKLIEHVYKNAKMPVIAHFKGLCHMYLDKDADLTKALDLVINSKTQRTGVCNAIETLLIHEDLPADFKKKLVKELESKGTELRVDDSFIKSSGMELKLATDEDWATEYLDNILSIKTVTSIDEAIDHIDQYGSFHTESIVSESQSAQEEFMSRVDASCVAINASSRFNDGGQLGLGAELGISTTKFHAYGPMGAEQMTTSRYVIVGDGNIRS